jgi:4-hydroxy-2-oxoheptanedioate aldolase
MGKDLYSLRTMNMRYDFNQMIKQNPMFGLCIMYPAAGIVERIGPDWDWIWIDGQHGEMSYNDMLSLVRVCDMIGRPKVVRVPGHDAGSIGKALDMSADGVMVPMVNNAAEAKAAVATAKFPPLGSRSFGGRRPTDLFGRAYANADQVQPLLICQVETHEGLANAGAIAAVEGVDVLFFGADDMAMQQGLPMDKPRPEGLFDAALKAVAESALGHHKICGGVFPNPKAVAQGISLGYRLIVVVSDVTLLAESSKQKAAAIRQVSADIKTIQ